jgi:hypothetical protein
MKEYLNEESMNQVRKECVIHSGMEHPNIAKLHEYAENENSIDLIVEHCNQPSYFEDRLEEVRTFNIIKKFLFCDVTHSIIL